jgi:hypothetical protein
MRLNKTIRKKQSDTKRFTRKGRLSKSDKETGFIILRHVNSKKTNMYWQEAYECIRKFYPENKIVIIDDNSNKEYLTNRPLHNTRVVQSEYPGRGELLPYYYYSRNNWFPKAVVIHDSVFLNNYLNLNIDKYKILWEFEHTWDKPRNEVRLIKALKNHDELLSLHEDKKAWKGCFGAMTIITHTFIKSIDEKYDLSRLLPLIRNRLNRMTFERVFACLLQANHKKSTLVGDIHKAVKNTNGGYTFDKYVNNYSNSNVKSALTKVWTGR